MFSSGRPSSVFGSVHPFGVRRIEHGPERPVRKTTSARILLARANLGVGPVERRPHRAVDDLGIITADFTGGISEAPEVRSELVRRETREHRRTGQLVAIQVQDRQDGAIGRRVEHVDGLPRCAQRSGFGLAVADQARDEELGIVQRDAEGVGEGIAELSASWRVPGVNAVR